MKFNNISLTIENDSKMSQKLILMSFIGILLSIVGYYVDDRFFHSYLVCYLFFITLSLGGLFFVLAHHMFGADWSVVLRRIAENLMLLVPLMLFLSIPILLKFDYLYEWTNPDFWTHHTLLEPKTAYLNKTFFFIRVTIYFAIWFFLISRLYTFSVKQKDDSDKIKMKRFSALGIALFALSVSFFGFDVIMSLDASWFSTMFGVYIFAGCYLSATAFVTLISLFLHSKGILVDEINEKHYANLGKILFAFTVFWAYIGGFQYYIIWYANLPEEIYWFIQRWEGPWKYMSIVLILGHFAVPFFILIFNRLKRNKSVLAVISTLVLIMHWLDMYWLVMPTYFRDCQGYIVDSQLYLEDLRKEDPACFSGESLEQLSIMSWTDLSLFIGIGGLLMALFWRFLKSRPIVASNDSAYKQSISKEED